MLQPKDWIWIFRGKQEKNESMWFIDFCWMLTPLKTPWMRRSFCSPAIFCRFSFRASRYLGDKWNQAMVPKQKPFESKSSFQNTENQWTSSKSAFFFAFFVTLIFWKRNPGRVPQVHQDWKSPSKTNDPQRSSQEQNPPWLYFDIQTDHPHIYFCKSLGEFAHHFNLQVISGACPTSKKLRFGFYFAEIKRFKQCKIFHQQMATTLSQQICLLSSLRSWATRADASQPWQFRLGDDHIFSYKNPSSGRVFVSPSNGWCVYLQIWVKGGLFCGANFETEGLRGLKYISEILTAPWRI